MKQKQCKCEDQLAFWPGEMEEMQDARRQHHLLEKQRNEKHRNRHGEMGKWGKEGKEGEDSSSEATLIKKLFDKKSARHLSNWRVENGARRLQSPVAC